jgi:hypothetical protein
MSASKPKSKPTRWFGCTVLQPPAPDRHCWQFAFRSQQAILHHETPADQTPGTARTRGWRQLLQPHLNLAWLPADRVYLRVLRLPAGSPEELPAMLELQLEKVSPLPVAQVAWSFQVVPQTSSDLQTVVLVIAPIAALESYLQELEQAGHTVDQLDVPLLHQAISPPPTPDCTLLHLETHADQALCLAAWWQNGQLESLNLLHAPLTADGPARLVQQLTRLLWAGEMEGWLQNPTPWRLIAPASLDPAGESALRPLAGEGLTVQPAPNPQAIAHETARRVARRESTVNLLPRDFAARYRQQFTDRLWMRGLASLLALYLLGVAGYTIALKYFSFRSEQLQKELVTVAPGYTNALALRERVRVLEEQAALKYAALDCLLVVSERLTETLVLTSFNFQGGRQLDLRGTVPGEDQNRITEFNAELRKATLNGQPLFQPGGVDSPKISRNPDGTYSWNFTARLHAPWLD